MAAKAIQHSIPGQLSSHINEEYPLFVEFLSGYYEWLEGTDSPYYQLRNHLSALDLKESLDGYATHLKNEYLSTIPEKVLADKEILIKHSKQFFQSLGSEKSFQFLFKILYNEDIELYYPKNDILRASNATWIDNENLMYVSNSGNVNNFLYRRITQTREPFPGVFEYATATVNRIINRYANKFNFAELYLNDIVGTFDLNYPVVVDNITEWILPIADGVEVISPGLNYTVDNNLTYAGDSTFDITVQATGPGSVDTRYTTIMTASDLTVKVGGVEITGYTYDGKMLAHASILQGSTVTISFPVYAGFLSIDRVGALGQIVDVNLIDTPFGIVTPQLYTSADGGSGGSIRIIPALTKRIEGYFLDNESFLSTNKVLQDSEYYQDYSYVIKAGIGVDRYRDVVMNVLHPAGLKMYGEVNIIEFIKLIIRDANFTVTVNFMGEISFQSSVFLYNRVGFVQDFMYAETEGTYKTNDFKDIVIADVFEGVKPLNRHFTNVTVLTPGGYVYAGYFDAGYNTDLVTDDPSYIDETYIEDGYDYIELDGATAFGHYTS
jgi:hypothetical protein